LFGLLIDAFKAEMKKRHQYSDLDHKESEEEGFMEIDGVIFINGNKEDLHVAKPPSPVLPFLLFEVYCH